MKKRKWHKGPPPSIGWWPASMDKNPEVIRWWDGTHWSAAVFPEFPASKAAYWAKVKVGAPVWLEWTDRWWL